MTNYWINAAELQWLKRSLWINAKVTLVGLCLLAAGGFQCGPRESVFPTPTHLCEVGLVADQSGPSRDVLPYGWRRTNRGWEHTSAWPSDVKTRSQRSISELVAIQQAKQPQWLKLTLSKVSGIPPLLFAVLQITAIAILMLAHRRYAK